MSCFRAAKLLSVYREYSAVKHLAENSNSHAVCSRSNIPDKAIDLNGLLHGQQIKPIFVNSARFSVDIDRLLSLTPHDVGKIVAISRSGVFVAANLAAKLHLPMEILRRNQDGSVEMDSGHRSKGSRAIGGESVLIVDDTFDVSKSLSELRSVANACFGANRIYLGCVYLDSRVAEEPDIWAIDLPLPHLFEWNLFNSDLLASCAIDFDGILCRDCNHGDDDDGARYAQFLGETLPLFPARRMRIPMIVTARLEKYRAQTLGWLKKWRISVDKLQMGPWPSLAVRNNSDVAAYKAEHFSNFMSRSNSPPPHLFIESDRWQAERIAELTGGTVICPAEGRCY